MGVGLFLAALRLEDCPYGPGLGVNDGSMASIQVRPDPSMILYGPTLRDTHGGEPRGAGVALASVDKDLNTLHAVVSTAMLLVLPTHSRLAARPILG